MENISHLIKSFLLFLLILFVIVLFANWSGYEGDDLNSVLPMLHLDDALMGNLEIYRYDWQPLSYLLGAKIYTIVGDPRAIFFLSAFSIALSLVLICYKCFKLFGTPYYLSLFFILLSPEIIYSGLYYNSSAIAYLFSIAAFVMILSKPNETGSFFIGIALVLSIFLRLDFLLILPCMMATLFILGGGVRPVLIAGSVILLFSIILITFDVVRPNNIIESYFSSNNELQTLSNMGGWDAYTKFMVRTTIFSPIGWIYYAFGLFITFRHMAKNKHVKGLILGLAFLPSLVVLPDLLSVKYLLPSMVILPFFAAFIWKVIADNMDDYRRRQSQKLLILSTCLITVVAIEPIRVSPYLSVSVSNARQIGTHDGQRSWGAYIFQVLRFDHWYDESNQALNGQKIVDALLTGNNKIIIFIGDENYFAEGAAAWRHAQLALEKGGYNGTVVASKVIMFEVGSNRLWITDDQNKLTGIINKSRSNICFYRAKIGLPQCLI